MTAVDPADRPSVDKVEAEAVEAAEGLKDWLLTAETEATPGPYSLAESQPQHPWWKVMCLTGVDYFSTLGYQPGIAALAAGALAPIATLILVLLTLVGALPMYGRVARESPHGEGSIAMLERLLSWWQGKFFVLVLLGFAATDFIITITLSAADAAAHAIENPFFPHALGDARVAITLVLVGLLGAIFLKGFGEAIGVAVILVGVYLVLNAVVIGAALVHVAQQPAVIGDWQQALFTQHGNPLTMLAVSLLLFPKLALGLSGFETGVAVMPLVKGDASDTEEHPEGRIRNTRRLLTTAALIMSVFLLTSSLATTLLIPPEEFQSGGRANGRALAFLAHGYFGEWFGTAYDISTIFILWFAGASALAGLLNLVPRYLPRYGMAPEWTAATRPLVITFIAIAVVVTVLFRADVDAQGGAYATGVLVLMCSAAVAVAVAARRQHQRWQALAFGAVVIVFIYTTVANVIERPEGVHIASFFIGAIILVSFLSRIWRVTELRVSGVEMDSVALGFIREQAALGSIRLIAHHPARGFTPEYQESEQQHRSCSGIPTEERLLFFEVNVTDPSDFAPTLRVWGEEVRGHKILHADSSTIPNAVAAFLLHVRDLTGIIPHAYFGWAEGNPLRQMVQYLLLGEGDVAPVAHEVLRQAEPNVARRPVIHVA